jgi:hypothetical protein
MDHKFYKDQLIGDLYYSQTVHFKISYLRLEQQIYEICVIEKLNFI